MAEEKKDDKQEELIEIVDLTEQKDDKGDTRMGRGREDGDDSSNIEGETEEQGRERRRQERRDKKERQRRAIARSKTEINFLEKRNEELERRLMNLERQTAGTQVMSIDAQLQQVDAQIETARQIRARAIDANNGTDAVEAENIERGLHNRRARLLQAREGAGRAIEERGQGQPDQQRPKMPPPEVMAHAKQFIEDHPWYNPQGGDEDSMIVMAVDAAVRREGFDPATDDYWDELRDRVEKRLPHKFEEGGSRSRASEDDDDQDERPARRNSSGGPRLPRGGNNDRGTGNGKVFALSAQRKQAMIDAGVWDDPQLRNKYIKKYMEWDKENVSTSRR